MRGFNGDDDLLEESGVEVTRVVEQHIYAPNRSTAALKAG
jgi:hypothetical protein